MNLIILSCILLLRGFSVSSEFIVDCVFVHFYRVCLKMHTKAKKKSTWILIDCLIIPEQHFLHTFLNHNNDNDNDWYLISWLSTLASKILSWELGFRINVSGGFCYATLLIYLKDNLGYWNLWLCPCFSKWKRKPITWLNIFFVEIRSTFFLGLKLNPTARYTCIYWKTHTWPMWMPHK